MAPSTCRCSRRRTAASGSPSRSPSTFQQLVADGDQVYVFDGVKDPEAYGAQLPTFNWRDPNYTTTTTAAPSTTTPPTRPPSTAPATTGRRRRSLRRLR